MRSNLFANIENKFEFADKDTIAGMAVSALQELIPALPGLDTQTIFGIILAGTKLGVAGDGKINAEEKWLIDEIFGQIWKGPMEQIYDALNEPITDYEYDVTTQITQLGNAAAMPFLHLILSFAYIDEVFEDEIAEKLDGLFGLNLMMEFFASGMEEVPAPKIKLTGLEAEIVTWFREDDQLKPLKDILARFSDHPASEVQAALDSLCEKGVLYGGEKFILNLYGLSGS